MTATKRALGKGLGALISMEPPMPANGVMEVDINRIEPNKQQPRKYFDEESLRDLAASITEFGVIQPLILKQEDGYYGIIAGERRWRAARMAQIPTVPAIIKDYSEMETLQIALIENLQRQDLNPIEEALCYRRLIDDFFFSQEDVAAKVGKSRNAVSYTVSLLNLDDRVQNFVIEGKLSPGHGRALLPVKNGDEQFALAERIIEDDLSIRVVEKMVKLHLDSAKRQEEELEIVTKQKTVVSFQAVENDLKNIFGTKVHIKSGRKKGAIEIEYYSFEDLDRLLLLMKKIEGQQK